MSRHEQPHRELDADQFRERLELLAEMQALGFAMYRNRLEREDPAATPD